jgi:NADPH2:quinone reductase
MTEILDLMRSGRLRVDVTEVFPLANAADAHRHLEQRASRGKLVLQVGGRG